MASDTMATWGDEPHFETMKLLRTKRFLLGVSGNLDNFYPMVHWINEQPEDRHPLDFFLADESPRTVYKNSGDTTILLVNAKQETFVVFASGMVARSAEHRTYDAVGSGADHATTAMHLGKTAPEAVRTAAVFDLSTGGPTAFVTFDHPITDYRKGLTGVIDGVKQITVVG